ncbi:hypothetical protein B0H19DRAFT_1141200 [Mycena capillaripes]|nr:hypothetical protein B0H19DRAFT_1141200 [Mycena capillaripes]
MDFVHSMEAEYGRPAKDFVSQCFRECPTVTSMAVVFSVIGFVPVVTAIALVLLICFLALTGILISFATLAIGALLAVTILTFILSIVLSAAFVLSAVTTLWMSCIVSFRTPLEEPRDSTSTTPLDDPTHIGRILSALKARLPFALPHPIPLKSRYIGLVLTILLRNPFARIFLPRWMRYRPFFPYLFGRNRTPHPLKWVILGAIAPVEWAFFVGKLAKSMFKFASFILKLVCMPRDIVADVGWDSILLACFLLLVVSPPVRKAGWAALAVVAAFLRGWITTETIPDADADADVNTESESSVDTTPSYTPPTADTNTTSADTGADAVPVLFTPGRNAVTTAVSDSTSGYAATPAASTSGGMRSRSVSVDVDSFSDEDWYEAHS